MTEPNPDRNTTLSAAVARALHSIVDEELPRRLDPLKREIRDTRSSIDRLLWRQDKADVAARERRERGYPGQLLVRTAAAIAIARFRDGLDWESAAKNYRGEAGLIEAIKSAVSPAMTTQAGWASELMETSIADFVMSLAPVSGFGGLVALSHRLALDGNLPISVPTFSGTTVAVFVRETMPIPVMSGSFGATSLLPYKLALLAAVSEELASSSPQNVEAAMRMILGDALARGLDAVAFDANAGSAIRPPGLLAGLSSLTPSASTGADAMIEDLQSLLGALGSAAAPAFVMHPTRRLAAVARLGERFDYPLLQSGGVAEDTVIAVDAGGFVAVTGDAPKFATSQNATLHLDDTLPLAIGLPGAPPTIASPTRSAFQEDTVALRAILNVSWGVRGAGAVAFIDGVNW